MSWWDRYVPRPRVWTETYRSETAPHIGPYTKALDSISSNITQVNTSKLLQVTTTKRIATSTTYFLIKTQNLVQQANSLTR